MDVSQDESAGTGRAPGYRLAWPAYIWPGLVLSATNLLAYCASLLMWQLAVAIMWLGLVWFTHRVLYLLSYELYTDAAGVWVFRGVFPWSKGVYGVRWRDLQDAVMYTGLFPWLTGSYRIRVGHRYTRGSEIQMSHVRHGDRAVAHINQRHNAELQADHAMALGEQQIRNENG